MRQQIPFFKQIPLYAKKIRGTENNDPESKSTIKVLSSPKMLTTFAPVASLIKNSPKGTETVSKEEIKKSHKLSKLFNEGGEELNAEVVRLPNSIKNAKSVSESKNTNLVRSPSLYLRSINAELSGKQNFCECGNVCEGSNILCPICLKSKETIEYSGYLYVKSKEKKLKKYYYKLLNKELYCYQDKDAAQHKRMHLLTGVFIKDEIEETAENKAILYPISLNFINNKKTFYAFTKEDKAIWLKLLKEAIGYTNLYDYYELKVLYWDY